MATSSDQSYDGDKQKQAAPNVQESQEAVDSSAKSSYALGSAQKPDVWGTERGPESFGHRSGDMFGEISDLLSKENALISEFEVPPRPMAVRRLPVGRPRVPRTRTIRDSRRISDTSWS